MPHNEEAKNVRATLTMAVDEALDRRINALRTEIGDLGEEAFTLVDALGSMLAGGKRLRPAFGYWGWRVHGGVGALETLAHIGAAHELFQAAALIHDDVMDDSDTRRGAPSSHRRFAMMHKSHGLTGDADRFGISAAIVLGDLALTTCDRELIEALADQPTTRSAPILSLFAHMQAEVWAGQFLDLSAQAQPWGADPEADEARAWQVIRSKSARYSVEHPFVMGALLADASQAQVAVCRRIGLPLGEAFQLRDDVLGLTGDPSVTGKPAGDDLREGKRTVVIARAARLARLSNDQRTLTLLTDHLGNPESDDIAVAELTEAILSTGAVDEVEKMITERANFALDLISDQEWPAKEADGLRHLVQVTVNRLA